MSSTINIQQNHGSDLKILCDQSDSVVSDLCKLSANVLMKGPSLKVYQVASRKYSLSNAFGENCVNAETAAGMVIHKISKIRIPVDNWEFGFLIERLGLTASQVQSAVEALIYLYLEACKNELNEESFREVVADLNLKEESIKILFSMYLSLKPVLEKALPQISVGYPEYSNLEWRFETQVSSKSIRNEIIPKVVMKLDLERGNKTESVCIQSDISNIIHMSQALNQALEESKTNHSRRVQRAVL